MIIILISFNSCADYRSEQERLKLERKKMVLKEQRETDKETCVYYGFKKGTNEFSDCLMNLDLARKKELITRKMLECEAVRRDNNNSAATGFWAGVLKGARENLACD
jgi:hypothetical protein|tara:strand:+ start:162 stop:482 length:321 start_codon:yes stop_codon:yes gene_type:complete